MRISISPGALPGLDTVSAMLAGNMTEAVYFANLVAFADYQRDLIERVRPRLAENDRNSIRVCLEAMIGNCHAVGANRLAELTAELHRAVKVDSASMRTLFDQLEEESEGLIRSIRALYDPSAELEVRRTMRSLFDVSHVCQAVEKLTWTLKRGNTDTVETAFAQLVKTGVPPNALDLFIQLQAEIDEPNYPEAVAVAEDLMRELRS